jgi:hypothetical protein
VVKTFAIGPLLDNQTTTLGSYTVPPGSYVIEALVRLKAGSVLEGHTTVFCDLWGGVQLDAFSTSFLADDDNRDEPFALLGWVDSSSVPILIAVQCRANYTSVLSTMSAERGMIVATKVGSVIVH